MFEDILIKQDLSIAQLSRDSGVDYNRLYNIIKNRTDISRCRIDTAHKIACALNMSLDSLYEYTEDYYQKKIYYQDQTGWDYREYGELNAEINKLFLIGIEYHFIPQYASRDKKTCKQIDLEISCIRYDRLSDETKCIMVAILDQQKRLQEFTDTYKNLTPLRNQKPLKTRLYLSQTPYNLFPSYQKMNIEY